MPLKLIVEQDMSRAEPEIVVRCGLMDERLKRLVEQLRLYSFSLPVKGDGITRQVPLEDVFYFESVENKTFLYTEKAVHECERKLYELEELLQSTSFVRISKNCICNTAAVSGVQAQFNGRLEAKLRSGERLIISKHYVPDFRAKFE